METLFIVTNIFFKWFILVNYFCILIILKNVNLRANTILIWGLVHLGTCVTIWSTSEFTRVHCFQIQYCKYIACNRIPVQYFKLSYKERGSLYSRLLHLMKNRSWLPTTWEALFITAHVWSCEVYNRSRVKLWSMV